MADKIKIQFLFSLEANRKKAAVGESAVGESAEEEEVNY